MQKQGSSGAKNPINEVTEYDGIILGAGHNALILQAYLGLAGLKTICLERRHVAGGGLDTEEDPRHAGVLHNTHSFYHRGITQMPWYGDLDLVNHGARYLQPDLNVALVRRDGEVLEWWADFERTVDSFSRFNRHDAQVLREWRDRFIPIVEKILVPETRSPPMPPERRRALLERTAEGRLLLQTSELSPFEFVLREFEDPQIQAGLLFFNGLREVDPCCKGFGHHIPALLAASGKAQMCLGGSASLAHALTSVVYKSGGEIRLNSRIRQIVVEGERALGVATEDDGFIRARSFVVSSLNPQQTFLDLLDEHAVPAEWREKAVHFKYNILAPLFAVYLTLREPPQYTAVQNYPQLKNALMVILGLEHSNQFTKILEHHAAGTIPPTVMWGSCPTAFDPSQAPAGKHTAFIWEKLPYRLNGIAGNWEAYKETHGRKMLSVWQEYAPNVESNVIDWFTRSPLDTERTLHNMRFGDLLVGAFTNGQVGYDRPFAGAGHYRAHVKGLYLCGSSSHPGGNITGLPGYNCAQVLLADLGLPAPWAPRPVEELLSE